MKEEATPFCISFNSLCLFSETFMTVNHEQTILQSYCLLNRTVPSAIMPEKSGDCLMSVFNMGQVLFPLLFSIILYWVDVFRAWMVWQQWLIPCIRRFQWKYSGARCAVWFSSDGQVYRPIKNSRRAADLITEAGPMEGGRARYKKRREWIEW